MRLLMCWKRWLILFLSVVLIPAAEAWQIKYGAAPPNNPPTTAAPAGNPDEQMAAKDPGAVFTNSVGVVLLKVPGNYWAGKYEVTEKEFSAVMGSAPGSIGGGNAPANNMTWNDAMAFCRKMTDLDASKKVLPGGYYYTLPTEEEWIALAADASLANAVTSEKRGRSEPAPVGSMAPNRLGLYDTRGNVMEFCLGDASKPYRVLKGGSWQDRIETNLRMEFRFYCPPEKHETTFGFRCVLKKK